MRSAGRRHHDALTRRSRNAPTIPTERTCDAPSPAAPAARPACKPPSSWRSRCRQFDVDGARLGVDDDRVTVAHRRDRAAVGRFGRDVPDEDAVGDAGEATVGDQRHVVAEATALELDGQHHHLGHAGRADGTDVAHDDDGPGCDLAASDGSHRLRLGVEHARGAAELALLQGLAGQLQHAALGRDVAGEDGDVVAGRCDGRPWPDGRRPGRRAPRAWARRRGSPPGCRR